MKKNTLYLLISNTVENGIAFILAIILARYLNVLDFGRYSFAVAYSSLFGFFFSSA